MTGFWLQLLLSAIVLAASVWLTGRVRAYALKSQLLDVPNERSAHRVPTPRGGGIGFVALFLIALLTAGIAKTFESATEILTDRLAGPALVTMAIGGAMVAAVGWWDDRHSLSPRIRLLVHFIGAFLILLPWCWSERGVGPLFSGLFPGVPLTEFALDTLGGICGLLFIVWVINLYNFMDGIDGLASGEAVTAALTLAGLNAWLGHSDAALLYAVLGSACLGFAFHNWPPARIFMGDVASGFLGFVFAGLAIWTQLTGGLSVIPTIIVLGVFVVDATYTLIDRARNGKKVWQSHSEHAYQHSARRWGHKPVSTISMAINLLWLAPLALWAAHDSSREWWALFVAYLPLLILTALLKTRLANTKPQGTAS